MNFENIFRSRLFVVILHICVWAIIFILPLYLESNFPPPMMNSRPGKLHNYENFRLLTSILNLSFIPLFYLNAFFFVPKFFNRKNWLVYLLLAILTVIVIIGLNILFRHLFIGPSFLSNSYSNSSCNIYAPGKYSFQFYKTKFQK